MLFGIVSFFGGGGWGGKNPAKTRTGIGCHVERALLQLKRQRTFEIKQFDRKGTDETLALKIT